jgi:PAS domain S-box-containing protein
VAQGTRVPEPARVEARLRETERMVGVGSWELVPANGTITYSTGFARLLGLAPDEGLNLDVFAEMVHPEDRGILSEAIARCIREDSASCEYRVTRRDGKVRTLSVQGEMVREDPEYLRGAILDVTDEREEQRERLAAVSLFEQGFDTAPIGMVFTHPEDGRYVRVNAAMCEFLQRSRQELLDLTFDDVTHPDDWGKDDDGRRAVLEGRSSSFQAEKRYLRPDGSAVWASLHVTPVRDPDGSVQTFFSQIVDISERKEREARLEEDVQDALWLARIRSALDEERLLLYSQPIVDLTSGETVQNELLLRMRDEDGSIIEPREFLPVAERYGLISEIDRWVIRQAVAIAAGGSPTEFNLSGRSIGDPDILRELESAIARSGADPSLLVVEVTETAIVDQLEAGRDFAEGVEALGCRLALDDFGTGYASLSYLKHIPAHYLKIDMEFVRELASNDTDGRLVEGIVAFAKAFDQTTVAEGVEDEATLTRLRELGVDQGQGYLFACPAPCNSTGPVQAPALPSPPGSDPVGAVRVAFDGFANRDLPTLLELCDRGVLLRAPGTSEQAKERRDLPRARRPQRLLPRPRGGLG